MEIRKRLFTPFVDFAELAAFDDRINRFLKKEKNKYIPRMVRKRGIRMRKISERFGAPGVFLIKASISRRHYQLRTRLRWLIFSISASM